MEKTISHPDVTFICEQWKARGHSDPFKSSEDSSNLRKEYQLLVMCITRSKKMQRAIEREIIFNNEMSKCRKQAITDMKELNSSIEEKISHFVASHGSHLALDDRAQEEGLAILEVRWWDDMAATRDVDQMEASMDSSLEDGYYEFVQSSRLLEVAFQSLPKLFNYYVMLDTEWKQLRDLLSNLENEERRYTRVLMESEEELFAAVSPFFQLPPLKKMLSLPHQRTERVLKFVPQNRSLKK